MKPFTLYLMVGGGGIAALVTGILLPGVWPEWRWSHEPLHSTLETVGGLAAIAMGIVSLQRTAEHTNQKFYPIAGGFLGMGILEVFHAVSIPGNGFVLLRGSASLLGGLGFGLMWFSATGKHHTTIKWMPWVMTGGALALGLWTIGFPQSLPVMVREGAFTPAAVAPKSFASMLFFAGSLRFFLDYRNSGRSEDFLFASLALMFGLAELMFTYSVIWGSRWWFWHFLRLMAYFLVLGYVGRGYLATVSELRTSLIQTKQAEQASRRSEQQLRAVLEDRERMARDLHDGVIQSTFALRLNLERCQRLIPQHPKEAHSGISDVLMELKFVIQDLRRHINGLEPECLNGQQWVEEMRTLVHTVEKSQNLPFHLQIDQEAADLLTPEEATHLLFVVKESISNSVRHSQATSGTVSLQVREKTVCLEVADNGLGFDLENTYEGVHGLKNMAARAKRLGAYFQVWSKPHRGTRIVFEIAKEGSHAKT
ncbi:sensor histidine kinase [uncultured Nitrospira sp.]|uniref:sensor histidine kinase n=1 Tax=uncultured Nitrospira sp. TaxID=157176 RepID=UPI00314059C6